MTLEEEIMIKLEKRIEKANKEREILDKVYELYPNIPIGKKTGIMRDFFENMDLLNKIYQKE